MPVLTPDYFLKVLSTVLFIFTLAACALPALSLAELFRANKIKSSLPIKHAKHIAFLSAFLWLIIGLALCLDFIMHGSFDSYLRPGPWELLWVEVCFMSVATFTFALSYALAFDLNFVNKVLGFFTTLTALLTAIPASALFWLSLKTPSLPAGWEQEEFIEGLRIPPLEILLPFESFFTFISFVLICIFFAIAFGAALSNFWLLLRRNKDKYGRDYYKGALRYSATKTFRSSLLILPCLCFFLFFSVYKVEDISLERWFWLASCFTMPLATLPSYFVSKSQNPLNMKTLTILSIPLLFIGLTSLFIFA